MPSITLRAPQKSQSQAQPHCHGQVRLMVTVAKMIEYLPKTNEFLVKTGTAYQERSVVTVLDKGGFVALQDGEMYAAGSGLLGVKSIPVVAAASLSSSDSTNSGNGHQTSAGIAVHSYSKSRLILKSFSLTSRSCRQGTVECAVRPRKLIEINVLHQFAQESDL
ncbi:hypothetical protein JJB09_26305 [Rhizobium sp. KVB221]|uniref:Uncharacterized protein n=1 Tax=Rhizobium setariae TaxID=2801340 RepID=A0A936YRI0_9HYPH|nr:hypothetical protein [Rhizobium setariae]MBL0375524.1 hypothetical protein [Rhizobium setariae]